MVLVKIWPFFHVFFLGNIGQENVFYNILEQENSFLAYENNRFKKSKNWVFPKGLTDSFGQIMTIFPCLFLGNIGQENVLYNILERKNAFLAHKKKRSKWPFFHVFFFCNIGQEKVFYNILEQKNAFLDYKKKKFK